MQAAVTVTCIVMAPFLASLGSKYVHQTIDNISLHHPDSRYICKVDIYYNIDNIMPFISTVRRKIFSDNTEYLPYILDIWTNSYGFYLHTINLLIIELHFSPSGRKFSLTNS